MKGACIAVAVPIEEALPGLDLGALTFAARERAVSELANMKEFDVVHRYSGRRRRVYARSLARARKRLGWTRGDTVVIDERPVE